MNTTNSDAICNAHEKIYQLCKKKTVINEAHKHKIITSNEWIEKIQSLALDMQTAAKEIKNEYRKSKCTHKNLNFYDCSNSNDNIYVVANYNNNKIDSNKITLIKYLFHDNFNKPLSNYKQCVECKQIIAASFECAMCNELKKEEDGY